MKKFKIGIEIECIINTDHRKNLNIGSYHSATKTSGLKHWKLSRDGSLNTQNTFASSTCVEFVSNLIRSEKGYFLTVNEFKKFLKKTNLELSDVVKFNESCGCHIHISFNEFKFIEKIHAKIYPKMRNIFFEKIRNSNISSKEQILEHYDRQYSKLFNKTHMESPTKYCEFNFRSELNNQGLEWRSPNMLNISKWSEYDEYFKIIFDCLKQFYEMSYKYEIVFNKKISVEKEKIQDSISTIIIKCNSNRESVVNV